LYFLEEDPGERINRYIEWKESDLVQSLQKEMLTWYQTTCDIVPKDYDNRFTEERIWIMVKKMCPPNEEETVRQMVRKGYGIMEIVAYCMKKARSISQSQ